MKKQKKLYGKYKILGAIIDWNVYELIKAENVLKIAIILLKIIYL